MTERSAQVKMLGWRKLFSLRKMPVIYNFQGGAGLSS